MKKPGVKPPENWQIGWSICQSHPLTASLAWAIRPQESGHLPRETWVTINRAATLRFNAKQPGTAQEWAYAFAHALLHLGYSHHFIPTGVNIDAWNLACDQVIEGLMKSAKLGTAPSAYKLASPSIGRPQATEEYCQRLMEAGVLPDYGTGDILHAGKRNQTWGVNAYTEEDWLRLLAKGIREAAVAAVEVAAGVRSNLSGVKGEEVSQAHRLLGWFMANYPLLSSLAAGFRLVEDATICRQLDIEIAAVSVQERTIYLNPRAALSEEELRFVMAHELLHVALLHEQRRGNRDPYIWNVACDYVINAWLLEMGIGRPPGVGILYDATWTNRSAEDIYSELSKDLRRAKRLVSLRGKGLGDILEGTPEWWMRGDGVSRDEWVRSAMQRGLDLHYAKGRGLLPGSLQEEIESLVQPPISWDAELAEWFQAQFPPRAIQRTYARASRRQSSTPDIVRPGRDKRSGVAPTYTFSVVLDTSGSMSEDEIAKGLGAIVSYAIAHEVEAVRLVQCDAAVHDSGFISPESLQGRVKIRGRGGTVLQPALDLLERLEDLPKNAPVLIITDGFCDHLKTHREHAYLLPKGGYLSYPPKGPLFVMD